MSLGFCQTGCYTTLRIQLLLMQEVLQCRKSYFDKGVIGLENPQKSLILQHCQHRYVDYFFKKVIKWDFFDGFQPWWKVLHRERHYHLELLIWGLGEMMKRCFDIRWILSKQSSFEIMLRLHDFWQGIDGGYFKAVSGLRRGREPCCVAK